MDGSRHYAMTPRIVTLSAARRAADIARPPEPRIIRRLASRHPSPADLGPPQSASGVFVKARSRSVAVVIRIALPFGVGESLGRENEKYCKQAPRGRKSSGLPVWHNRMFGRRQGIHERAPHFL